MTSVNRFKMTDLFSCAAVNLDKLTENFNLGFYGEYLAKWPDFFSKVQHPDGKIMGYVMGKAEGPGEHWHGHVTAITVAPEFRRVGLANSMMAWLESVSEHVYNGYFVDLFVRKSNNVAVGMYERLGYSVYREVVEYYTGIDGTENAYDMRKALPRDVTGKSSIPTGKKVMPHEVDP